MVPNQEAVASPLEYIIQDEPEYLARIKVHSGVPFLHLDFKIWTPTAFKKLLKAWAVFRSTVDGTFLAISNGEDDDKWRKFVERLGFTYSSHVDCPDGIRRRCYISRKDTNG